MAMKPELLTPLELKVMNLLWKQEKAFVKDLLANWPDKEIPAYNTVSTIVRILEDKAFVSHEAYGRSHQYYALVGKREYQKRFLRNAMENVFAGSFSGMISSLLDNKEQLSREEREQLKDLIDNSDSE